MEVFSIQSATATAQTCLLALRSALLQKNVETRKYFPSSLSEKKPVFFPWEKQALHSLGNLIEFRKPRLFPKADLRTERFR